ncbi:uncharacterized protein CIMG_06144 [Coccidioides immitis RS]|uniref:Uncharacterized protein n=1 Tax=Coccidioides immitis (strain RS) TaxID=246410 RepID=J3K7I6_COCIM|nr:uncharacterized protein CIMG_06144 [Coccidioides immitis RS]EAS30665.3 hypothetical protein CIMG_06144 [Coccidioides immitis RS]
MFPRLLLGKKEYIAAERHIQHSLTSSFWRFSTPLTRKVPGIWILVVRPLIRLGFSCIDHGLAAAFRRSGGIVLLDILMVVCDAGFGLDESTSRERFKRKNNMGIPIRPSDATLVEERKKEEAVRPIRHLLASAGVAAGTINDPVAMMPLARPRSGSQASTRIRHANWC